MTKITARRLRYIATHCAVTLALLGGGRGARAATRVQSYSGGHRYATPCFVQGDQVGAVFDIPANEYPIAITRIGVAWGSLYAGTMSTTEAALHVYNGTLPNPGFPVFTLPSPTLAAGITNEFDLSSTNLQLLAPPAAVTVEFAHDVAQDLFAPSVMGDGAGCTAGHNLVFTNGGWQDACALDFKGNWVFWLEYQQVNCVTANGPGSVVLNGNELDETVCTTLNVVNTGCDTLLISSIVLTGPSVFAVDTTLTDHSVAPGDTAHIVACVTPESASLVTATVTVNSNAWNSPTTIPLSCYPNCISATGPGPMAFQNVGLFQTACTELVVTNEGCDTMFIFSIARAGSTLFAVDTTTVQHALPPGGHARIPACVTPNGPDLIACEVSVVSNAWNSPTRMSLSCLPATTTPVSRSAPRDLAISNIVPNPFNPHTTVHFVLPHSDRVTAEIWSATGARVRTLARDKPFPGGSSPMDWDGRNDAGQAVASGVYFIRIRTRSQTTVGRMTLLK